MPHHREPIPDRRRDHAGETFVPPSRRWSELSTAERVGRTITTYAPLVTLAATASIWLGFRLVTPSGEVASLAKDAEHGRMSLQAKVDSLSAQIDTLRRDAERTARRADLWGRYLCLNADRRTFTFMDCATLYPGIPVPARGAAYEPRPGPGGPGRRLAVRPILWPIAWRPSRPTLSPVRR